MSTGLRPKHLHPQPLEVHGVDHQPAPRPAQFTDGDKLGHLRIRSEGINIRPVVWVYFRAARQLFIKVLTLKDAVLGISIS